MLMLVVVEKAIYQAQSQKQSYSQTKSKTSHLFKCYSLNVVHACSIVVMDAGLYFTLVSLLFSAISFLFKFLNIIFTLVHISSMDIHFIFLLLPVTKYTNFIDSLLHTCIV